MTTGSGPDVVLLHGLGATHASWTRTVQELSDYRCHAVDLPGFGESWPPPAAYRTTIAEQAEIVVDYLNANKIASVRLVGHSMGGGVCLHIAEQLAKAGTSDRVAEIAFVAPALVAAQVFTSLSASFTGGAQEPGTLIAKALLKRIYFDWESVDDIDAYAAAYGVNFTLERTASLTAHTINLGVNSNFALNFSSYEWPMLLFWGDDERVVEKTYNGSDLGELRNAEVEEIERCGHVPHEEHPGEVNPKIKAFFDGLPA
ncbi:MAG: alpha/beta fold hydrolase [Pseudomonadota bacterium]